jgi:2-keto-4-pentenoate hydratase/2-oxohepta-3-ene-1,7-dioic acid hydratase in catechol pathway
MVASVRLFRAGPAALLLEVDGRTLDLSAWIASEEPSAPRDATGLLAGGFFARKPLERSLSRGTWRKVAAPAQVLVPIEPERVGKILALGKNFKEHAAEFGEQVPEQPLFFNKLPETLAAHGATVRVPTWYTARVDHEAELALIIGKAGYDIDAAAALQHVAGYTIADDLTARTLQGDDRKLKYPWFRAKNLDGFCPLGPCIVPRDFLDTSDLRVTARVVHRGGDPAGEARQDASTRDLIVSIPEAVAWLSKHLTLRPGDVILMGTPAGVGPLQDGDEVICAIEHIGALHTRIARPAQA